MPGHKRPYALYVW